MTVMYSCKDIPRIDFQVSNSKYHSVAYTDRTSYGGFGLFARKDLAKGTVVGKFEGPIVDSYSKVPVAYRSHALLFRFNQGKDENTKNDDNHSSIVESSMIETSIDRFQTPPGYKWLITMSDAGLVNHKCRPNVALDGETLELVTICHVPKDTEFGFIYNQGGEDEFWDDVCWSFSCGCGADWCQGRIDRYRQTDELGRRI